MPRSQMLLASGTSHTGQLGWIRRRIVPVGAFPIVTEPLPKQTLDRLLPRRRMAVDTKNLVNYFRTTPDNRLLFGGRARSPSPIRTPTRRAARSCRRHCTTSFPDCATHASTIAGAAWST